MREGFSQTYDFIRDRSRAVRNDFTMQHETGPLAIECHDRCARFHILALHLERESPRFSVALEEQQLMAPERVRRVRTRGGGARGTGGERARAGVHVCRLGIYFVRSETFACARRCGWAWVAVWWRCGTLASRRRGRGKLKGAL